MAEVLIIGCGISGLSCAIALAEAGIRSTLVSPFPSERAQSVMASGGINAVDAVAQPGDSVACHISDTLEAGRGIAGAQAVEGLCTSAPALVEWLERHGMVFTRDASRRIDRRAFGGQSFKRTCYSGAATGKQMVSALVMEARRFEAEGLIARRAWSDFHSALINEGVCHGALLFDEAHRSLEPVLVDAVVMATGGQNALFGKTTGATTCDGYSAGRLFQQGVELKNLEFIQYHPTTIETAHKRMLVSEAARGEGGRLFVERGGERVYFMEERFGEGGNLMPRDVVSRCMDEVEGQVYLDVSFLGRERIERRIPEVRDICLKYRDIDIAEEPIPVEPSVHFFMGGIAVDNDHETCVRNLFAVGECASIYHGANRLGGNSLLAALYSGRVAAQSIAGRSFCGAHPDFATFAAEQSAKLEQMQNTESRFPVVYVGESLAETMRSGMGIVRDAAGLAKAASELDALMDAAEHLRLDNSVLAYFNYSLPALVTLARAAVACADFRKESRGAHIRSDYPDELGEMAHAIVISCAEGELRPRFDLEGRYEN